MLNCCLWNDCGGPPCCRVLTGLLVCLQYDYGQMLGKSQDFYRSQWVGDLTGRGAPSWRGNAFTTELGPSKLNWGDITGGVMEGGDAGRQAQLLERQIALLISTCALLLIADAVCAVVCSLLRGKVAVAL